MLIDESCGKRFNQSIPVPKSGSELREQMCKESIDPKIEEKIFECFKKECEEKNIDWKAIVDKNDQLCNETFD